MPGQHVTRDRKEPRFDGPRGLVGTARSVESQEGLLVKVSQILRVWNPGAQEAHDLWANVVQKGTIGLDIPTLCLCHPLRPVSLARLTAFYCLDGFRGGQMLPPVAFPWRLPITPPG